MPSTVIIVVAGYAITSGMIAAAIAIAVVASVVMNKAFAVDTGYGDPAGNSPNLGNRQQVPPATDNKLPVVYGSAYVGGIITDLSITSNNQTLYYVLSLCEVTNNGADTITFGDVYFGGKKVIFDGDGPNITGLLDTSTGITSTTQAPYLQFYFYSNGSYSPTNSSIDAITLMQSSGLTYTWDNTKLMTNCAFVIMVLKYNSAASITGLQQTKFQVTNSRDSAGDCFYDYLTNTVYGAALPVAQVNTASLTALNTYSNGSFAYTDSNGNPATQPRFKFNGIVDVKRTIMQNLQDMSACCDCLVKYNEITAQWGVVVQTPVYDIAMALNDSNMVSAISISPLDLSGSYNVAEVKYPDNSNQDSFNSVTYDLAQIDPALLFPNEPVNKQSLNLPLCNNDVQAQYLATRFLKSAREDLQVQVDINFSGIQLEAGDIVTITNSNYGWVAKEFRINKVIENFADDGAVLARLTLSEFNSQIYDDLPITQFTPAPNTGIGSPTVFGTVPAPIILNSFPIAANPLFLVSVTTASAGITQYAEVWYSAYSTPTVDQLYFAGTSEIQSSGTPWDVSTVLPPITLANIPAGNWYLFSRMVNSLGSSQYSPASTLFQWRPSTFQYSDRYLVVAYADAIDGTGFSLSPTNKEYYGLLNQDNTNPSIVLSDYTWYLADPNFGTAVYLAYSNRSGRKFSFATGFANYAAATGAFVPTQAAIFDPSIWSALPDGINYIDLDHRTGQLIETGTTTIGTGEIAITNNQDGKVVASLKPYLDFGGAYQFTSAVANLTVDIYGRVVGFEAPDGFLYSDQDFTATAGQTVFTVTSRTSGHYIAGNAWFLINGLLQDPSTYTDTTTTLTSYSALTLNDIASVLSFTGKVITPTSYYSAFTIDTITLTNVSSYDFTGTGITLNSGYEVLFLNGVNLSAQDYDIIGQVLTNFPNLLTGELVIIQFVPNNLGTPAGNPVNLDTTTVIGQVSYPFSNDPLAFNLYQNGVALVQGTDFTVSSSGYTLTNTPSIIELLTQQTFARTESA